MEEILDLNSVPKLAVASGESAPAAVFPTNLHISHFYKSKEDLLELLIPFFQEGLNKDEYCLWGVGAPLTVKEATAAMDASLGGALFSYIETGQLEIFDVKDYYQWDNFDAAKVRNTFLQKVMSSIENGWPGFRCNGMTSGVDPKKWKNFQIYEGELTQVLPGSATVICSYDLNSLSAEAVVDVVSTHQASIMKKFGRWHILQSAEHMALKDSRQKQKEFQELADHMAELAWIADSHGVVTWFNKRWHEYTGISQSQLLNDGWKLAFDPEELPLIMENWSLSVFAGKSFKMILKIQDSTHTFHPFLVRAMPLLDQNGRVSRWFATCTDISQLTPLFKNSDKAA